MMGPPLEKVIIFVGLNIQSLRQFCERARIRILGYKAQTLEQSIASGAVQAHFSAGRMLEQQDWPIVFDAIKGLHTFPLIFAGECLSFKSEERLLSRISEFVEFMPSKFAVFLVLWDDVPEDWQMCLLMKFRHCMLESLKTVALCSFKEDVEVEASLASAEFVLSSDGKFRLPQLASEFLGKTYEALP